MPPDVVDLALARIYIRIHGEEKVIPTVSESDRMFGKNETFKLQYKEGSGRRKKDVECTYKVSTLSGEVVDNVCISLRVEAKCVDKKVNGDTAACADTVVFLEARKGEPLQEGKMSPEWWLFLQEFMEDYITLPVDEIYAPAEGDEGAVDLGFSQRRAKLAKCSQLLASMFAFPDKATATLFVSAWLMENAKVVLKGVPGSGKTTAIESSTMLFTADRRRYEDALFYHRFSVATDNDPCPCGKNVPFKDCCKGEDGTKYKVREKAADRFEAKHFMNMMRKEWARCTWCNQVARSIDSVDIAMVEGETTNFIKCSNPQCRGRSAPFSRDMLREVFAREMLPQEPGDYVKFGFSMDRKVGSRGTFSSILGAAAFRESVIDGMCSGCKRRFIDLLDEIDVVERDEENNETARIPLAAVRIVGPVAEYSHRGCGDTKVVTSDIYQIKEFRAGFLLNRYTNTEGYYYSVTHFEPVLGVAKITPKKRPEEIFYYTKIEKEIESVEEARIKTRERFIMPPVARAIVPARVKFFNEFNRCMKPDTMVVRRDGAIVPIDALVPGDSIAGFARGYGADWVRVRSKSIRETGTALEIGLTGGQKLVMSPNHHCIVFEKGVYVHKRADAIRKGDVFVQSSELEIPEECVPLWVPPQDDVAVEVSPEMRCALSSKKSELGWTYDKIEELSGISRSVIHNLLSGRYFGSTMGAIRAVSETLGVAMDAIPVEIEGRSYTCFLPEEMSPDVSELLGYFTGDGGICPKGGRDGISFTDENKELLVYYASVLEGWGLRSTISPKSGEDAWRLRVCNTSFNEWVRENFRDAKENIPTAVVRAGRPVVCAYLRGLFDAEGWVNEGLRTVNIDMTTDHVRQAQILLRMLGISSNLSSKKARGRSKVSFELTITGEDVIKFRELVGFNHPERARKLSDISFDDTKSFSIKVPTKCVCVPDKVPRIHRFDVKRSLVGNGLHGFTRDRWANILGSLDQPAFTEPVVYLPVVSVKNIPVDEGYLVDIEVEDRTETGLESDHVFLAESLVLTGNSRPEVQDEVLSLLEEGEVEYKGESFYTNTPFVAFFDLNPHKEQKDVILDWAFYDRLDLELVFPTMNFGSKADILFSQRENVRNLVFGDLVSDYCNKCKATFPRWLGWDKDRRGAIPLLHCRTCDTDLIPEDEVRADERKDAAGVPRPFLVKGTEPMFIKELDEIRKDIRNVELSTEASLFLAILSDFYSRTYLKYVGDQTNPMLSMRRSDITVHGHLTNPFVDMSTVQWWARWSAPTEEGRDARDALAQSQEGGLASSGEYTTKKLFMSPSGGGLLRPLGFRVCLSVMKAARARTWFLTMTRRIQVGPKIGQLPEIVEMSIPQDEVSKARLLIGDYYADDMLRRKRYFLKECPFCGEPVPEMNPNETDGEWKFRYSERRVGTGADAVTVKEFLPDEHKQGCKNCGTVFTPLFKIEITPEDILQVFPYCASMRFCADYQGNNIPKEVWEQYPNVLDWLRSETRQFMMDGTIRGVWQGAVAKIIAAMEFCRRMSPEEAISTWTAYGQQQNLSRYPFYYQFMDYLASRCGPDQFDDRCPRKYLMDVDVPKAHDLNYRDNKRPREAWDR